MSKINLKKAGLKATLPRIKIFNILTKNRNRHMSAEDIYHSLIKDNEKGSIGFATIYRVLTQFELAGLIIRHKFGDDHFVFELSDYNHDHFLCVHCNRVEEFSDKILEERKKIIANKLGFRIIHHSLYLYGECKYFKKKNCEKYRKTF